MFRKLSRICRNIRYALKYDFIKEKERYDNVMKSIQEEAKLHRVLMYASQYEEYKDEVAYLQDKKHLCVFPYPILKRLPQTEGRWDSQKSLPYVFHNNYKLYFPCDMTPEEVNGTYRYYIEEENLLGGGYTSQAPHQYLTDKINPQKYDVLIDLGAAEGLLTLDVVDKLQHVVLVEPEKKWMEPLHATFAPFAGKTTIINKFVSDKDSESEVCLRTLIDMFPNKRILIKMDIEGEEYHVLKGLWQNFEERKDLAFLCCTYHKAEDAENVKKLFELAGYATEFSNGYMLFGADKPDFRAPYFRKGLIRAWRE